MIGIYKITNQLNGKSYIGQSIDIERRWRSHKTEAFNIHASNYDTVFYRAIRKYGLSNFTFEVIEECAQEDLNEREKYWIKYYNTYVNNYDSQGYNMTEGGETVPRQYNFDEVITCWNMGYTFSEIIEKFGCSSETIANYLNKANIPVEERRYRANNYKAKSIIQYDLNGKQLRQFQSVNEAVRYLQNNGYSQASTSNIVYACNEKITTAYNSLWSYASDNINIETLVAKAKEKKHHRNQRVGQYDKNNNLIQIFPTITEAARAIGNKSISSITNACTGRSKTAGGFIWKYL